VALPPLLLLPLLLACCCAAPGAPGAKRGGTGLGKRRSRREVTLRRAGRDGAVPSATQSSQLHVCTYAVHACMMLGGERIPDVCGHKTGSREAAG